MSCRFCTLNMTLNEREDCHYKKVTNIITFSLACAENLKPVITCFYSVFHGNIFIRFYVLKDRCNLSP